MLSGQALRDAECAMASVDLTAAPLDLAASFAALAQAVSEAEAVARSLVARMEKLGEPGTGALMQLVAFTRADAESVADDFRRLVTTFHRSERAAVEGVLTSEAARAIVAGHVDVGRATYRELLVLLERADSVELRARTHYDRTFAEVLGDPERNSKEAELDAAGEGTAVAMTAKELASLA